MTMLLPIIAIGSCGLLGCKRSDGLTKTAGNNTAVFPNSSAIRKQKKSQKIAAHEEEDEESELMEATKKRKHRMNFPS